MIREDTALIIAPVMIYFLITLVKHKQKIKKLFFFFTTITPFYFITILIEYLRFGSTVGLSTTSGQLSSFSYFTPDNIILGATGLLFSPGLGLFIFAPIVLTIFFTFPDFYKKNKGYTFLFITFI